MQLLSAPILVQAVGLGTYETLGNSGGLPASAGGPTAGLQLYNLASNSRCLSR